MLDYGRRFLVVIVIATFIGLLFIGVSNSKASGYLSDANEQSWVWPAAGDISDHFGTRAGKHKGIDIAGDYNSDIYVVSDGIVSKSYYSDSYGHVVFVEHPLEGYETVYAHLNERMVNEGENVKKGQVIGKMGNTGRSSGVHLHFEVHRYKWTVEKENALNPITVFNEMYQEDQIVQVSANKQEERQQLEGELAIQTDVTEHSHIVKEGETLWSIGEYYGISMETLVSLNEISDPNLIFVGQVIQLKDKQLSYQIFNYDPLFALNAMGNAYEIS